MWEWDAMSSEMCLDPDAGRRLGQPDAGLDADARKGADALEATPGTSQVGHFLLIAALVVVVTCCVTAADLLL